MINNKLQILILQPEIHFDNTQLKYVALQDLSSIKECNEYFSKELCEITQSSELADFIFVHFIGEIIPKVGLIGVLDLFSHCDVYIKYHWKFIFLYRSDCSWKIPIGGTWLRTSYDKRILSNESIPIPYFTEQMTSNKYIETNICKLRANFVGALTTHPIRDKLVQFLVDEKLLDRVFLIIRKEFHSKELITKVLGQSVLQKRKMQSSLAAKNSYITLCPRGTGLNTVRFYETMSYGRIPLLVSENCILPLSNIVNYEEFSFNVLQDQFNGIHNIVNTKEAELTEMCKRSYEIYKEFLSIEKFGFRLANYLKGNIEEIYYKRKKDNLFKIKLNNEDVYNYIFNSLIYYTNLNESVNVLEMAQLLKKMTKNESEHNSLDFIIKTSFNAQINTNNDYEEYIKNLPFAFDNRVDKNNIDSLIDSYFKSIIEH